MGLQHSSLIGAGLKPKAEDIEIAELVPNLEDGTLWSKNDNGTVIEIGKKAPGRTLATVVELIGLLPVRPTEVIIVTEEGRGGTFVYDTSRAGENDGGTVFDGWVRQYDGAVNVKWFGAKGDGVTDDTTALQKAVDNHTNIKIPKATFLVHTGIKVGSNKFIYGEAGSIIIQPNKDDSATISTGTEYSGFTILENSENVHIDNIEIRGPFYSAAMLSTYRSIGIAVQGRYDAYFYNNVNWPGQPSVTPSGISRNIKITNCMIIGFGQSGILVDNITDFVAKGNYIHKCGRDGIRMYGCRYFDVSENRIDEMSDGFDGEGIAPNNNVYGISATRVYNSATGDGDTSIYRPSNHGTIARNHVSNCANWKALDTHGGTDIAFIDNIIYNAYIGIGIDKGGYTLEDGFAPPRRILVKGNIIKAGPDNTELHRAGITVFAHEYTNENVGEDIIIADNYIEGFGLDTKDGGIVPSNIDRLTITGNHINDSLGRCIHFQNDITNCNVKDNILSNTRETTAGACYGINVAGANQYVNIDDNIFRQSSSIGSTMKAIVNVSPNSGYGVLLGANSSHTGDVINVLYVDYLVGGSQYSLATISTGLVLSDGTLSAGTNVSVACISTGRYDVTVLNGPWTKLFPIVTPYTGTLDNASATIRGLTEDTFTVLTFASNGALADTSFYFQVNGYK